MDTLIQVCDRYLAAARNYEFTKENKWGDGATARREKAAAARDVIHALKESDEVRRTFYTFFGPTRFRRKSRFRSILTCQHRHNGHLFLIDRSGALHAFPETVAAG